LHIDQLSQLKYDYIFFGCKVQGSRYRGGFGVWGMGDGVRVCGVGYGVWGNCIPLLLERKGHEKLHYFLHDQKVERAILRET
jgi:hypothetical protein